MKYLSLLLIALLFLAPVCVKAGNKAPAAEFYEIKIYHIKDAEQEKSLDNYLQNAYLPALHKAGIGKVGVFKALANDTAADKQVYVFIPVKSVEQWLKLPAMLEKDESYKQAGRPYIDAVYNAPVYMRIESILLRAFRLAPQMSMPALKAAKSERVYELRSYESASEKLYNNKVEMFNEGGEIPLFRRLNFNAVFYAEVISGSHMPNLMYMTSFENKTERDAHWKTFGADPEWKQLSGLAEYAHTVIKADIILMQAAEYSD